MVQLKGVLRMMGLMDAEVDSDTETSEDSVTTLDTENHAMAVGKKNNAALETSPHSPGNSTVASPRIPVKNPALSIGAHSGSDSEAAMTRNKRKTHKRREEEAAKLAADDNTTSEMERQEGTVVVNLACPTLSESQVSDTVSVPHVPPSNFEADTTMPAKKKRPRKKQKKNFTTADVTSSPASDTTVTATADSTKVSLVLKPRFGFDDYRDELKCRRHGCAKLTNCYDGSTVICPRCGVKSFLRYCCLECLLDPDMRYHWAQECDPCPLQEESPFLVDESTLIIRPAGLRPYIECEARDNPARHRQAVFHSANGTAGDYFVFNDYALLSGEDRGRVAVIGAGKILAVVSIVPDYGLWKGKSIFHEILEDCLRTGFSRPDKCLALVDVITKQLVGCGQWSQEIQECLVFQMRNEFGYDIPQEMLLRFGNAGPASA